MRTLEQPVLSSKLCIVHAEVTSCLCSSFGGKALPITAFVQVASIFEPVAGSVLRLSAYKLVASMR